MPQSFTLLADRGCGSAIVEIALEIAGVPYEIEAVDYAKPGPLQDRLRQVNPLLQVPAALLPDGSVLTESGAMGLLVADMAPGAGLVPPPGAPQRARFLRWLMVINAALYPTFTYGDDPAKWVGEGPAAAALRQSTDARRQEVWRMLEAEAGAPWFLGDGFSLLDAYVVVMTRWRPGPAWFTANCPKLVAIARAALGLPAVAKVMARNFPA